jgi:cytochrome-b5 reductase
MAIQGRFTTRLLVIASRKSASPPCGFLNKCTPFHALQNRQLSATRALLNTQASRNEFQQDSLTNSQPLLIQHKNHKGKYSRTDTSRFPKNLAYAIAAMVVCWNLRGFWIENEPTGIFNYPAFTPCTLVKREDVSPTSFILTLQPRYTPADKNTSDPYKEYWEKGTWSLQVKQPELQIARSYTPLPPVSDSPSTELRFLIRKEYKGEVSSYLDSLRVGSQVDVRGPYTGIDLPADLKKVVFLAGGTGIAPALQVAYTLLERGDAKASVHILWANRKRDDCEGATNPRGGQNNLSQPPTGQIVQEIRNLQRRYPDRLTVDYIVDEEGSFVDEKKVTQLIKLQDSAVVTGDIVSKWIFVSGPEGFVNYLAGPRQWDGGKEGQGALGGLLGRMKLSEWKVWKH